MTPTVFLGLVTHVGSRFPEASGPNGLVHQVSDGLTKIGVASEIHIHNEDHFDSTSVSLTHKDICNSITAELELEARWRQYINPHAFGTKLNIEMFVRRIYRQLRLAPPWQSNASETSQGAAMLRRLINIELAHLNLLNAARVSGAAWTLIVEDDAQLAEPQTFVKDLAQFINDPEEESQPKYINVSQSFTTKKLRLDSHLTAITRWSANTEILSADRPLTNTVCAILYRNSFLDTLIPALNDIPMQPVLPIDWKLNEALLDLHAQSKLGAGDCWFLEPAPIVQGSMS